MDPVEKLDFFDRIRQSEFSVEKSCVEKARSNCVSKPDWGFGRNRPFSTDESDCIRTGLSRGDHKDVLSINDFGGYKTHVMENIFRMGNASV